MQANDKYWIELLEQAKWQLKSFNCVETIAILMCKQINSYSFQNEITYKLFTYKSYVYP